MTEINKNIKKVKTTPIDYFNNLLKYKSNTDIPRISFGHGIPMYTPVDYHLSVSYTHLTLPTNREV